MMPPGTPLSDWLAWLETLSPTEIDLGLERMQVMLDRLDPKLPQHVLLVAGTNGKGSSVAMCDGLLRATGVRVGAYTSPHIHRYNERIIVDGAMVSDAAIVGAFERIEACRAGLPLTYFEYGTLAAILAFADHDLDAWILEVGLGGRLDACNALSPTASLVTNVALDHCEWLGNDVETIATEKAGVMRRGIATVYGGTDIPKSLREHAADVGAILLIAGEDFKVSRGAKGTWSWHSAEQVRNGLLPPGLSGDFQIHNAAAVLALLDAIGLLDNVDSERINATLPGLSLSGRMQRLFLKNRLWIADVAHNPAAATALADTLAGDNCTGATVAIVGLLRDKDVAGVVTPLAPSIDRWIAVTADSQRALDGNDLARQVANLCGKACLIAHNYAEACEYARRYTFENDRILISGSFFTVGPVLRELKWNVETET